MDQRYIVFTHRTTLKLSTQLTDEEYRVAIAKANRMRLEDLPPLDSQAILAMIKERMFSLLKFS